MKLEKLNEIAKVITAGSKDNTSTEVTFKLNEHELETIQQEVYKFINKTIHGYTSKKSFEIIISDIRFVFKRK
jgi:hypothetical protein